MVDGTKDYGNFHQKVQLDNYESAVTQGSFDVLSKRIKKINTSLDSIMDYQKYEREQENLFRDYQMRLSNSIFIVQSALPMSSTRRGCHLGR